MLAYNERNFGSTRSMYGDAAYSGGSPWTLITDPMSHAQAGMTPQGWALCHGPVLDKPHPIHREPKRKCECGKTMSRYNTGTMCFACEDKA